MRNLDGVRFIFPIDDALAPDPDAGGGEYGEPNQDGDENSKTLTIFVAAPPKSHSSNFPAHPAIAVDAVGQIVGLGCEK